MESIAAVVCDDKAATSARRAVVAPASDRVRDYWIGARRAMAGSLFTASGLFYLSAWWDSGLTQAPPNPTGIVRMLPLYAEVGGTFGLGALAILCALLLPLYLGFTGRGMIRGVESNDHLQEALAVQEVREHLILYLSFGGAVTGWLLLPVAASSVALALPIVVVVGVLCCLVALREETAAQGLMRHARAQQARKGLLSLLSNLGVAAGEPKPPAESDRRRARRWETAAQVAWVIPTFLVLWLPLRRGDPASAWWMAAVLASFFCLIMFFRSSERRNARVARSRRYGVDKAPVLIRRGGRAGDSPTRGAIAIAPDLVVVAILAMLVYVSSGSGVWLMVNTAVLAVQVFFFDWWRPARSASFATLLHDAAVRSWRGIPSARRAAGEDDIG